MAFVCESKRIFHEFNQSTKNIGPGQYESPDLKKLNKTVAARVPFNSSNIRRSIYDKTEILDYVASAKTGPGYYDIDYSFVKGNVKTYANNHSVIVKIDSLQSQEFKSKVPRFKSLENDLPGPGEYSQDIKFSTVNYEIKKQSLEKRKHLKDKIHSFLNDLKKKNHISSKPSIPSKTLKLKKNSPNQSNEQAYIIRESKTQSVIKENQPSFSEQKDRKVKGFTWAKSQRKLSVDAKRNPTERDLGPGKYFKQANINQNQKLQSILPRNSKTMRKKRAKTESSIFMTKYPRTFFDEMYYETHSKDTAEKNDHLKFKSTMIGPGYYEIESPLSQNLKKNKNLIAYQFFGSTVERFPTEQKESAEIYDLIYPNGVKEKPNIDIFSFNSIGKQKSFNIKDNAFLSSVNEKKTIFDRNDMIPGPGEYEIENIKEVFKPKKGKIIQNFGNSNERFPSHNTLPKEKSPDEVQDYYDDPPRKKKQQESFMFKSKIKKQPLHLKSEQSETFGKYDVTQTDLGTKLQKQVLFLQNLKKIEVNIPAFNSANPRFEYDKKKKSGSLSKQAKESGQKDKKSLFLNTRTDKMRDFAIQKNKEQVINSKKSTIYNPDEKLGRFRDKTLEEKLRTPGVGQYSLRSNWTKQTYNLKYHKSYVMAEAMNSNSHVVPFESIEQITEEER